MIPRPKALAGLALASLLLAGACSRDVLIGDEQGGTGAAPGTTSTSTGGGAPASPIDPDAAARVAIRLRSCGLADAPEVILDRFYTIIPGPDDAIGRLPQLIGCIDASVSCLGVQACLGASTDVKAGCTPTCEGTVLHDCDGNAEQVLDCAKLGLTCSPAAKRCVAAPLGPACDQATFVSACENGIPTACNGTVVHGPDCAQYGMICEPIDTGTVTAVCKGAGPACDSVGGLSFYGIHLESGVACDGNMLRACVNGREHSIDCTQIAIGFSCQTAGSHAFCGLASDCIPGEEQTICNGVEKSLTICNAGRRDQVSCVDLGFPVGCADDACALGLGGP